MANFLLKTLLFQNRQHARKLNLRLFRKIFLASLKDLGIEQFELGIYIVGTAKVTRMNETFLRHKGSTDVITFDYSSLVTRHPSVLHGEIFVCIDEAMVQAKRFRTSWQSELVRYAVHGILHLSGYDDRYANQRRKMKREEDRLVKELAGQFDFKKLAAPKP